MLEGLDFWRLRGRDLPSRLVFELVRSRFVIELVEGLGDGGSGVKAESVRRFFRRAAGALSGEFWVPCIGVKPVSVGLKILKLFRLRRSAIVSSPRKAASTRYII